MRASSAKRRRVRLDADAYRRLHQEILERDGWRCQLCGSMAGVEVHHYNCGAKRVTTLSTISSLCVLRAIEGFTCNPGGMLVSSNR